MELLAGWLFGIGACDLLRGSHDEVTAGRARLAWLTGMLFSTGAVWVTGLSGWWLVCSVASSALMLWWWVVASSRALHRATWTYSALTAFALPAVVALGLSGRLDAAPPSWFARWFDELRIPALAGVSPTRFVLGLAVVLFLLNTTNVLVRVILRGANAPAAKAERTLKGGRLLGPMERVFIFALALSGNLAAASVVAAAKSLLRFPEIRTAEGGRVDSITEYFLIGSFSSWLFALLFIPLFR